MDREQAIKELQESHDIMRNHDIDESESYLMQALNMAIKALEQEPCEDAISRQAVLDVTWEEPSYTDALNVLTEVRDKVKALPPVNPQELCEDAISRKEAISIAGIATLSVNQVVAALKKLPSVKPKSEWEHDHEILKAYSDGANEVLDKIKAEIKSKYESIPDTFHHYETGFTDALEWVLSIIDKYKEEGSGEE